MMNPTTEPRVPDPLELARWEHSYRMRYARDHAAPPYLRGNASNLVDNSGILYDATTMAGAVDTLARLEAEVPDDPPVEHAAIAQARAAGFDARRGNLRADENPHWMTQPGDPKRARLDYDLYMAWHAGWVQGDADAQVRRMAGYTPPPPLTCVYCKEKIGYFHTRECPRMAGRQRRSRVKAKDAHL